MISADCQVNLSGRLPVYIGQDPPNGFRSSGTSYRMGESNR